VLVLAVKRDDLAGGADEEIEGAGRDEEEPTLPPVVAAGGAEGGVEEGISRIAEGDGILMLSMPCAWRVGDRIEMEGKHRMDTKDEEELLIDRKEKPPHEISIRTPWGRKR